MRRAAGVLLGLFGLLFFLSTFSYAQAPAYPDNPQGYVSDYAQVINSNDKQVIEQFASELENKTTAQLAVVTVPTIYPESIEGYAVTLFKKWGIGQKGKDNGVLLIVALQDHKIRIETGYGLEGVLTDALCSRIIQEFITPSFKAGEYSSGLKNGAMAIISLVSKANGINIAGQEVRMSHATLGRGDALVVLVAFGLFVYMYFWRRICHIPTKRSMYSSGGWSGGYGDSFGGGFGGFGGGSSGGGGASGGW